MTAATVRIEPGDYDRAMIVYATSDGRTASIETSRRPDGPWEPIEAADKPKPVNQQEPRQ